MVMIMVVRQMRTERTIARSIQLRSRCHLPSLKRLSEKPIPPLAMTDVLPQVEIRDHRLIVAKTKLPIMKNGEDFDLCAKFNPNVTVCVLEFIPPLRTLRPSP